MIITLLRKPLEGSVADNTLKHGCGTINIDDTRVGYDENESINFEARQRQQTASYKESGWSGHVAQVGSDIQMYKEKGRWPANFILIHKEVKGTKKIKEGVGNSDKGGTEREVGLYKDGLKKRAKDHHQGEETVADWDCVESCPVKELDRQSGIKTNTSHYSYKRSNGDFIDKIPDMVEKSHWRTETGGASRYFKQFKKFKEDGER